MIGRSRAANRDVEKGEGFEAAFDAIGEYVTQGRELLQRPVHRDSRAHSAPNPLEITGPRNRQRMPCLSIRLNTFSRGHVKHLGGFVQMHAHFLAVGPLTKRSPSTRNTSPLTVSTPWRIFDRTSGIRAPTLPFSTVRSPTHCRNGPIDRVRPYHTQHDIDEFRDGCH
jgi:hypothetical protein